MATSAFLSGRKTFKAKYGGVCFGCQSQLYPDDMVFYPRGGTDNLCGDVCCGDKDDEDLVAAPSLEDSMPAMEQNVPLELVMPRGKTHRDKCNQCWQIPSSSGACGCDA